MTTKIGLALGSGADRGYAHIGVIKTLLENHVPIDCIAGTSMGALVGAYFALKGEVSDLEQLALSFSTTRLIQLLDWTLPTTSFIRGLKIRKFLTETFFGDAKFSDTQIPLAIVATRLEDGLPYIFNQGLLVDAVLASGALPGLLPPFEIDGVHLIDGGLAEAVPLTAVASLGADLKIGVDLYSYALTPINSFGIKEVLARTYRLYLQKLSAIERQKTDDRSIIICPQTDEGIETLAFSRAKPNIDAGCMATAQLIPQICQLAGIKHT